MKKNKVQKNIVNLNFKVSYDAMKNNNYNINFNNLSRDFHKVDTKTMYMFLMYAISQDETVDMHLAICNYLYFMDPYIYGADMLIKWHLTQALKISPYNSEVLTNWIFGVYNGNPDCPFSEAELSMYRQRIKKTD